MDDIYDNLHDYEEILSAEQLQEENADLKNKIKDISDKLAQLQANILQDHSKLLINFKNLESNFSTLLKTAKSEIERKSILITNLNTEKDQIFLRFMNNQKFTHKPTKKNLRKDNVICKEDTISNRYELCKGTGTNKEAPLKDNKIISTINGKVKEKRTELNSRGANISDNDPRYENKTQIVDEPLENYRKQISDRMSRRKSTSDIRRIGSSVNSDQENCERNIVKEAHSSVSKSPSRITSSIYNHTKKQFNKHDPRSENRMKSDKKVSDNNMRQQYDTQYRHHDYEKRFSENHESRDRRKESSPAEQSRFRSRDRQWNNGNEEYQYRRFSKYPEVCNRNKSRDRYNPKVEYNKTEKTFARHRSPYDNRPSKQKLNQDCEQDIKRHKFDDYNENTEKSTFNINNGNIVFDKYSCQSPDELFESPASTTVKEILTAGLSNQEDPRIKSDRYKPIIRNDQIVGLCTSSNKDTSLAVLHYEDCLYSCNKIHQLPPLLMNNAQFVDEDLVKEIYDIDMENQDSLESGEINSRNSPTKIDKPSSYYRDEDQYLIEKGQDNSNNIKAFRIPKVRRHSEIKNKGNLESSELNTNNKDNFKCNISPLYTSCFTTSTDTSTRNNSNEIYTHSTTVTHSDSKKQTYKVSPYSSKMVENDLELSDDEISDEAVYEFTNISQSKPFIDEQSSLTNKLSSISAKGDSQCMHSKEYILDREESSLITLEDLNMVGQTAEMIKLSVPILDGTDKKFNSDSCIENKHEDMTFKSIDKANSKKDKSSKKSKTSKKSSRPKKEKEKRRERTKENKLSPEHISNIIENQNDDITYYDRIKDAANETSMPQFENSTTELRSFDNTCYESSGVTVDATTEANSEVTSKADNSINTSQTANNPPPDVRIYVKRRAVKRKLQSC